MMHLMTLRGLALYAIWCVPNRRDISRRLLDFDWAGGKLGSSQSSCVSYQVLVLLVKEFAALNPTSPKFWCLESTSILSGRLRGFKGKGVEELRV